MTNSAEELSIYLPGGVVLPSGLDVSLRQDRLVVFVGAGASIDDPSGLPDFKELTPPVAEMCAPSLTFPGTDHMVTGTSIDGTGSTGTLS